MFFDAGNWKKDDLSLVFKKLACCYKKWERGSFSSLKNDKMIFLYYGIPCLLVTKKFLFWNFEDRKYGVFWVKKAIERWYFVIAEKFLFWTFQRWEIWSFFELKSWWKDDIYWLLRSSYFKLFGDGKHGLFSAKKMIFTWSF